MSDTVSVIIPVYNVEKYVEECVYTVLNQTYKDIEVLLVDDGSTDDSGNICDRLLETDSRIKVIHKPNGGLSSARNAGMKEASGQYYFFLDSDDYINSNSIEVLMEDLIKNCADLAIGGMLRTSVRPSEAAGQDDNSAGVNVQANAVQVNAVKEMSPEEAFEIMCYGQQYSTSACGKLFKRELFDNIEFPDGKFCEDLFTIYKTILRSKKVTFNNNAHYYYYHRNEGSIVVAKYSEKHLEAIEAVDNILRDVLSDDGVYIGCKGFREDNKYKLDRLYAVATLYYIVIYDIAARNPKRKDFLNDRIMKPLKENRSIVIRNGKAPARLRLFAVLTLFGSGFAIKSVFVYNHLKWKIRKI